MKKEITFSQINLKYALQMPWKTYNRNKPTYKNDTLKQESGYV